MRSARVLRWSWKAPRRDLPQMNMNPRNVKVSGLPSPRRWRRRRIAAELQQAGLLPMKLERELLEPLSHRVPEAPRIGFVLEADDDIVGIAHDDDVAGGFSPSPLLGPEIEDVVQVDVGEQRRCHRPLRSPRLTDAPFSVFQNARLEPLAHKADDALVADPVLQEPDQPCPGLTESKKLRMSASRIQFTAGIADRQPTVHPAHRADCARAGTHTRTRGSLPRRSR